MTQQEQEQGQEQEQQSRIFAQTKEDVEREGRLAWQLVVKISTTPELRENPELLKILYEMNDRFLTSNYRLKEHQYRV